jgi:hypothetical protein
MAEFGKIMTNDAGETGTIWVWVTGLYWDKKSVIRYI